MFNVFGGIHSGDYNTRPPESGLKSITCTGCKRELTSIKKVGNEVSCPFCGKRLEYQVSKSHEREP